MTSGSRFARIARWAITHRWQTILAWFVLVIAVNVAGASVGLKEISSFRLPDTESQRAYDVLARSAPEQNGLNDQFVFVAREGTLRDGPRREAVESALEDVAGIDEVISVSSPFDAGGLSPDGRIGVAQVVYDLDFDTVKAEDIKPAQEAAFAARAAGLEVENGGPGAQTVRFSEQEGGTELVGILVAFVVLIITFGSVIAAGVPLLTALLAIAGMAGLVPFISQVVDTPDFAMQLAILIGLGVGVDYALIVLTRYRSEVAGGFSRDDAIVRAIDTAGRTVFFAALTVVIALLGLLLLGLSFMQGVAIAAVSAVLLTMIGALTVLPALVSRAGDWIDRWRIPMPGSRKGVAKEQPGGSPAWQRWAEGVQKRPWAAVAVALVVLVGLALPALGMRLGSGDASLDPEDATTKKAYDAIAEGFGPGVNGSFLLAIELGKPGDEAGATAVARAVGGDPNVDRVAPPTLSKDGRVATVTLFPRTGPQEEATNDLLTRLREEVLPPVERATGTTVSIGGATASNEDFAEVIAGKLPLFVAMVVILSALLLTAVFRSVFIPLKAAAMNLLSIGAALGFVTLVFQEGIGAELIGVGTGPIESFVPVMLFAIVFGLSMDYEVFLMSRVHEEWIHHGDASRAVRTGLATTGRVITAAAAIMVLVFAAFAIAPDRVIKLFGLGLAIAVFLDALVIRCLLVPALMELMGKKAWWIPGWLDRVVPRLALEKEEEQPREKVVA
ncbi:MAG: putative integral rane protein [Solirubrobacterales bacterium]|nr:putative integral rane protein [Solirubrobacterales bacterium]